MDKLEERTNPLIEFSAALDDAGTATVTIAGELDMSSFPPSWDRGRSISTSAPVRAAA
jgi:hypothetical protein